MMEYIYQSGIWSMTMCDVMWCDKIRWDINVAIVSISSNYWNAVSLLHCVPRIIEVKLQNNLDMIYEVVWCDVCDEIRWYMSVAIASISNHYWGAGATLTASQEWWQSIYNRVGDMIYEDVWYSSQLS